MAKQTDTTAGGKRPIEQGAKRNLIFVAILVLVVLIVAAGMIWRTGRDKVLAAPETSIGGINPTGSGEMRRELSPAMQEKRDRVFREEAKNAIKQGRSYIPNEGSLGPSTPIDAPPQVSAAAETGAPAARRMGGSQSQSNQDNAGLTRQLERIMANGMGVKAAQVIAFKHEEKALQEPRGGTVAAQQSSGGDRSAGRGEDLTQGLEIHPAEIISPIDTDKTDEAIARITGGPLAGATFVGKLVVFEEDFAMGFTSMRYEGKYYQVQAVGVNEQTASRAMGADVDHRFFDRYVMPVLSSGLWGAATYFTERGRTATKYVPTGIGGDIVVSDERASQEDAKNKGIGEAIKKSQQITEAEVQRRAAKKNRMTLPQYTPIGIRFEQPVYPKDAK